MRRINHVRKSVPTAFSQDEGIVLIQTDQKEHNNEIAPCSKILHWTFNYFTHVQFCNQGNKKIHMSHWESWVGAQINRHACITVSHEVKMVYMFERLINWRSNRWSIGKILFYYGWFGDVSLTTVISRHIKLLNCFLTTEMWIAGRKPTRY